MNMRIRFSMILAVLGALALSCSDTRAPDDGEPSSPPVSISQFQDRSGWVALAGKKAARVSLDPSMRAATRRITPEGGVYERFQQIYGNAKVRGGQITTLSDVNGVATSVIGRQFPNIVSSNTVRLSEQQALDLAAGELP